MNTFTQEVNEGRRFEFGANWTRFLKVLNEERITEAKKSLQKMLAIECLEGKRFLDIGSGSGLFSLAARQLGAQVYSFDYDPQSVACTAELKRRYFLDDDTHWVVQQGSALDNKYLQSLGQFDIVYSWGVLHHTGAMWQALENVTPLVNESGKLFIAIYNDQGGTSIRWRKVKQFYCSGILGKLCVISLFVPYFFIGGLAIDVIKGQNPFKRYTEYKKSRGMSRLHDWIDWLGGYPFEVAKPEQVFDFYQACGFSLRKLKTCGGGLGCNEFVFKREK